MDLEPLPGRPKAVSHQGIGLGGILLCTEVIFGQLYAVLVPAFASVGTALVPPRATNGIPGAPSLVACILEASLDVFSGQLGHGGLASTVDGNEPSFRGVGIRVHPRGFGVDVNCG